MTDLNETFAIGGKGPYRNWTVLGASDKTNRLPAAPYFVYSRDIAPW